MDWWKSISKTDLHKIPHKIFSFKTIKKQTHKLYMLISIFYRNNYSCMLIDVIDFLNAIHIHNQNIVFTPHNHYT